VLCLPSFPSVLPIVTIQSISIPYASHPPYQNDKTILGLLDNQLINPDDQCPYFAFEVVLRLKQYFFLYPFFVSKQILYLVSILDQDLDKKHR
jgi:hypothetical protein